MTASHDDAWERARERSREDVRAAFAPRRTTCPACGAEVEADTRTCPACGASLVQTRRRWRPGRRAGLATLAVVVVGGTGLAVWIGGLREDAAADRASAAQRRAALVRDEERRLTALGQPRTVVGPRPDATALAAARNGAPSTGTDAATVAEGPAVAATRAYRKRLLAAGEAAVLRDARARQPGDPPRGATCRISPVGPGRAAQETDPGVRRNRYVCIAYERRIALARLQGRERTGVFGIPYWLVADYRTGGLTLCRMTPRGGEAATTLATVPVDPACREPFGRRG